MSQQWGPPNYPPPPPPRQGPQYQLPETAGDYGDYYEEPHDTTGRRVLIFLSGSCLTLFLVACCVLALAVAWVIDERFGITTPKEEATPAAVRDAEIPPPLPLQPTAPPTQPPAAGATQSPAGPSAAAPAGIGQPVVSTDTGVEMTVLDIQRNVQPNNLAAANGMEFVAVSVQLRSVQPAGGPKKFSINDFQLQNGQGALYSPDPQADNGRRLQDMKLPENTITEGDLLFHIPLGDAPLFLVWQGTGSKQTYTIALQ